MSRKFIVVAALVVAGFIGSPSRAAHAAPIFDPDLRPTDIFDRDPVIKPADLECIATRATADAKMAKSISKCDRAARRNNDLMRQRKCRNKAVKKNLTKTAALTCGVKGGGSSGGTGSGGVIFQYSCSGLLCSCVGDADCNDMFTIEACGDISSCDTSGPEPVCWCLAI